MRGIRFALEDERDYLAAEHLAADLAARLTLDDVLPVPLAVAEHPVLLALGLVDSIVWNAAVAALLAEAPAGLRGVQSWWLAAHAPGWLPQHENDLYQPMCDGLRTMLPAIWAQECLICLSATEALMVAMDDPDELVRSRAMDALGVLGRADAAVIAGLLAALDDEVVSVLAEAGRALGLLARHSSAARQMLEEISDGQHGSIDADLVRSTARIPAGQVGTVPTTRRFLRYDSATAVVPVGDCRAAWAA